MWRGQPWADPPGPRPTAGLRFNGRQRVRGDPRGPWGPPHQGNADTGFIPIFACRVETRSESSESGHFTLPEMVKPGRSKRVETSLDAAGTSARATAWLIQYIG